MKDYIVFDGENISVSEDVTVKYLVNSFSYNTTAYRKIGSFQFLLEECYLIKYGFRISELQIFDGAEVYIQNDSQQDVWVQLPTEKFLLVKPGGATRISPENYLDGDDYFEYMLDGNDSERLTTEEIQRLLNGD